MRRPGRGVIYEKKEPRQTLEGRLVWGEAEPRCPKCGAGPKYQTPTDWRWATKRADYRCRKCRRHYRATFGTLAQKSRFPRQLEIAAELLAADQKITARQIAAETGRSYDWAKMWRPRILAMIALQSARK